MAVQFNEPGTILFSAADTVAMGPDCCCGATPITCTFCQDGTASGEVQLDISGITGMCESLNGTYILAWSANYTTSCVWEILYVSGPCNVIKIIFFVLYSSSTYYLVVEASGLDGTLSWYLTLDGQPDCLNFNHDIVNPGGNLSCCTFGGVGTISGSSVHVTSL
jgi:hypothetical protein